MLQQKTLRKLGKAASTSRTRGGRSSIHPEHPIGCPGHAERMECHASPPNVHRRPDDDRPIDDGGKGASFLREKARFQHDFVGIASECAFPCHRVPARCCPGGLENQALNQAFRPVCASARSVSVTGERAAVAFRRQSNGRYIYSPRVHASCAKKETSAIRRMTFCAGQQSEQRVLSKWAKSRSTKRRLGPDARVL